MEQGRKISKKGPHFDTSNTNDTSISSKPKPIPHSNEPSAYLNPSKINTPKSHYYHDLERKLLLQGSEPIMANLFPAMELDGGGRPNDTWLTAMMSLMATNPAAMSSSLSGGGDSDHKPKFGAVSKNGGPNLGNTLPPFPPALLQQLAMMGNAGLVERGGPVENKRKRKRGTKADGYDPDLRPVVTCSNSGHRNDRPETLVGKPGSGKRELQVDTATRPAELSSPWWPPHFQPTLDIEDMEEKISEINKMRQPMAQFSPYNSPFPFPYFLEHSYGNNVPFLPHYQQSHPLFVSGSNQANEAVDLTNFLREESLREPRLRNQLNPFDFPIDLVKPTIDNNRTSGLNPTNKLCNGGSAYPGQTITPSPQIDERSTINARKVVKMTPELDLNVSFRSDSKNSSNSKPGPPDYLRHLFELRTKSSTTTAEPAVISGTNSSGSHCIDRILGPASCCSDDTDKSIPKVGGTNGMASRDALPKSSATIVTNNNRVSTTSNGLSTGARKVGVGDKHSLDHVIAAIREKNLNRRSAQVQGSFDSNDGGVGETGDYGRSGGDDCNSQGMGCEGGVKYKNGPRRNARDNGDELTGQVDRERPGRDKISNMASTTTPARRRGRPPGACNKQPRKSKIIGPSSSRRSNEMGNVRENWTTSQSSSSPNDTNDPYCTSEKKNVPSQFPGPDGSWDRNMENLLKYLPFLPPLPPHLLFPPPNVPLDKNMLESMLKEYSSPYPPQPHHPLSQLTAPYPHPIFSQLPPSNNYHQPFPQTRSDPTLAYDNYHNERVGSGSDGSKKRLSREIMMIGARANSSLPPHVSQATKEMDKAQSYDTAHHGPKIDARAPQSQQRRPSPPQPPPSETHSNNSEYSTNRSEGAREPPIPPVHDPNPSHHSTKYHHHKRRKLTDIDEGAIRKPLQAHYGWERRTLLKGMTGSGPRGEVTYVTPCGKRLRSYPEVERYVEKNNLSHALSPRHNFSFSSKIVAGKFFRYAMDYGQEGDGVENKIIYYTEDEVNEMLNETRLERLSNIGGQAQCYPSTANSRGDSTSSEGYCETTRTMEKVSWPPRQRHEMQQQASDKKNYHGDGYDISAGPKRDRKAAKKYLTPSVTSNFSAFNSPHYDGNNTATDLNPSLIKLKDTRGNECGDGNMETSPYSFRNSNNPSQQSSSTNTPMPSPFPFQPRPEWLRLEHTNSYKGQAAQHFNPRPDKYGFSSKHHMYDGSTFESKMARRRYEIYMAKEMKKPQEDMCIIRESKVLPELPIVPGIKISKKSFSHLAMVVEFVHNFGEILGINTSNGKPTIYSLQASLLNARDQGEEVNNIAIVILAKIFQDPDLCINVDATRCIDNETFVMMGKGLLDTEIDGNIFSELLRLYIESHPDSTSVQITGRLSRYPFVALSPADKLWILSYLCDRLIEGNMVMTKIDNELDITSEVRKEKWANEGEIRRMRLLGDEELGQVCETLNNEKVGGAIKEPIIEVNRGCGGNDGTHTEDLKMTNDTQDLKDLTDSLDPSKNSIEYNQLSSGELKCVMGMEKDLYHKKDDSSNDILSGLVKSEKMDLPKDTEGEMSIGVEELEKGKEDIDSLVTREMPPTDLPVVDVHPKETQMEKLLRHQREYRKKLYQLDLRIRASCLGQDRYKRRYWVLPYIGAFLIEGMDPEVKGDDGLPTSTKYSNRITHQDLLALEDPGKLLQDLIPLRDLPAKTEYKVLEETDTSGEVASFVSQTVKSETKFCEIVETNNYIRPPQPIHDNARVQNKNEATPHAAETRRIHTEARRSNNDIVTEKMDEEKSCLLLQTTAPKLNTKGGEGVIVSKADVNPSPIMSEALIKQQAMLMMMTMLSPLITNQPNLVDIIRSNGEILKKAGIKLDLDNLNDSHGCTTDLGNISRDSLLNQEFNKIVSTLLPNDRSDIVKKVDRETDLDTKNGISSSLGRDDTKLPFSSISINRDAEGALDAGYVVEERGLYINNTSGDLTAKTVKEERLESKDIDQKPAKRALEHTESKIGHQNYTGKWWYVKDMEQLQDLLTCLNERGIREKDLHKNITKYMEITESLCSFDTNQVKLAGQEDGFTDDNDVKGSFESNHPKLEQSLIDTKIAMNYDIRALEAVEYLETKVNTANMQNKFWVIPPKLSQDSTIIWSKDSNYSIIPVQPQHEEGVDETAKRVLDPLIIASQRLAALELGIERRYIKPPLGKGDRVRENLDVNAALNWYNSITTNELTGNNSSKAVPMSFSPSSSNDNNAYTHDVVRGVSSFKTNKLYTPLAPTQIRDDEGLLKFEDNDSSATPLNMEVNTVLIDSTDVSSTLSRWRLALSNIKNSSQLHLCLRVLRNSIAWEKSIMKVFCQLCLYGNDEDKLLLCDGCDKGYHTYCLKPKMENVPDGDWFCHQCISRATGDPLCSICGQKSKRLVKCEKCTRLYHQECFEPPILRVNKTRWKCPICTKQTKINNVEYLTEEPIPPSAIPLPTNPITPLPEQAVSAHVILVDHPTNLMSVIKDTVSHHGNLDSVFTPSSDTPVDIPFDPDKESRALEITSNSLLQTCDHLGSSSSSWTTTKSKAREQQLIYESNARKRRRRRRGFNNSTALIKGIRSGRGKIRSDITYPSSSASSSTPTLSMGKGFKKGSRAGSRYFMGRGIGRGVINIEIDSRTRSKDGTPLAININKVDVFTSTHLPNVANNTLESAGKISCSSVSKESCRLDSLTLSQTLEKIDAATYHAPSTHMENLMGNVHSKILMSNASNGGIENGSMGKDLNGSCNSSKDNADNRNIFDILTSSPDTIASNEQITNDKNLSEKSNICNDEPIDIINCRNIVNSLKGHKESWPFLRPVNTKIFPQYKRVIKNPMDLHTLESRINQQMYKTNSEFIADVKLIFDNCETFNEDDSKVGKAGHILRKYFEILWNELWLISSEVNNLDQRL